MNQVRIIRSGLCSTVQDTGRVRFRHLGVAVGGAMDLMMHELANQLVGNTAASATIEMTLTGDEMEFGADTLIAITGADMTPVLCHNECWFAAWWLSTARLQSRRAHDSVSRQPDVVVGAT